MVTFGVPIREQWSTTKEGKLGREKEELFSYEVGLDKEG
jgi:hypothetical protein